jgi:ComF family protein
MFLFSQLYFPPESWDLITAVPLHPTRERERDYNQSSLLAQSLGKSFEVSFSAKTLRRVRGTQPQSNLSGTDRRRNVESAFHARPELVNGKRILLVDDLLTTGATLNQCASSLKGAGARRVDGLTLARTPLT